MKDKDFLQKLSSLGYSTEWIEAGILTESRLDEQLEFYNTGEDPNLEHYRYKTLTSYINSQTAISDHQLNQLLKLIRLEQDESMAGSVVINLLKKDYLTKEQFQSVSNVLREFGEWTEKEIKKQDTLRQRSSNYNR